MFSIKTTMFMILDVKSELSETTVAHQKLTFRPEIGLYARLDTKNGLYSVFLAKQHVR